MKDLLYCVKLTDASEDFGLAAEMLAALELDFSSFEDRENRCVYHTVYCETREQADEVVGNVSAAAREWSSFGVELIHVEQFELKKEDWAEVWKKHFSIIPISERLIVKPSWLEAREEPGVAVIEIDPGMSFGTGQHATTFFCLKMIDKLAPGFGNRSGAPRNMLDAGCGSGILAIGAALLGYDPVDAFDYDAEAVRIATENFELNHIESIQAEVADAAVYPGREGGYDLVCANILGHLLKAYRMNIASWVKPGGHLALAGILSEEFEGVAEAFQALGFTEVERETLREWTSGLFRKAE